MTPDDRSLVAALSEAFTPHLRKLVQEEVARAELQWRLRTAEAGELLGISEAAVQQRCGAASFPGTARARAPSRA